MKNKVTLELKGLIAVASLLVAAWVTSCSSDNEPVVPGGEEEIIGNMGLNPDEDGKIFLYKDHKVEANTDFTMEEFEKEFHSYDTWEEVTISTYDNGSWAQNFNTKEGYVGWTYQNCFEFDLDGAGTGRCYSCPYYCLENIDTIRYLKIRYDVDAEERTLTYKWDSFVIDSMNVEMDIYETSPCEAVYTNKIVAVDSARIVLDYHSKKGWVSRVSIQPFGEIKGVKIPDPSIYFEDKEPK